MGDLLTKMSDFQSQAKNVHMRPRNMDKWDNCSASCPSSPRVSPPRRVNKRVQKPTAGLTKSDLKALKAWQKQNPTKRTRPKAIKKWCKEFLKWKKLTLKMER